MERLHAACQAPIVMLNDRLGGYLAYFERIANQPANRWEGFNLATKPDSCAAPHFQLAFSCYALAALCLHPDATPEEQTRCRDAMAALIARMSQRRVWAFWGTHTERSGLSCDPIAPGNLQYSAPLAMMLGAFETAGGDDRYDEDDIVFLWSSDARYSYSHMGLVDAIWRQMRSTHSYSVEGTVGRVYVPCMAHALWATRLHDARHGSEFADANAQWLGFIERRFIFGGPSLPGRRVFSASYSPRSRIYAPISLNFVDAWGLALLAPLAPDLVSRLAPRLLKAIRRTNDGAAFLPSAATWQSREWADGALATGFAYLLAVELQDHELADALLRYADSSLDVNDANDERFYNRGVAAPYTTALFALGEAGGLARLRAPSTAPLETVSATNHE